MNIVNLVRKYAPPGLLALCSCALLLAALPAAAQPAPPAAELYITTADSLGLGANLVTRLRLDDFTTTTVYLGGAVNKPAGVSLDSGVNKAFMMLAVAGGQKIAVINLSDNGVTTLATTAVNGVGRAISGLAVDKVAGTVYYSAASSLVATDNKILRVMYDGTVFPAAYSSNGDTSKPLDLAVDNSNNKLFIVFSNGTDSWIASAGLYGSGLAEVAGSRVSSNGAAVGGLVLDTVNEYLYYTVTGGINAADNKIFRINYDGSNRQTLYSGVVLDKPSYLALDQSNNIYAAFTGSDYQVVKTASLNNPASMVWSQVTNTRISNPGVSITGISVQPALKITPTVNSWPTAGDITYGQPLSSSTMAGGSASVPGSFTFDLPAATPNAGTYSAAVTFTPTDTTGYNTVSGTVAVAVARANPGITTCPTAANIELGLSLSAATLSGGTAAPDGVFAFSSPGTTPAATGTAAHDVNYTPGDRDNYNSAVAICSVNVTVVDTTRPAIILSTLSQDAVTANRVLNLAGSVTDLGGIASFTINGINLLSQAAGFNHAVLLKNGANSIEIIARDAAGNETKITRTISCDRSAPVITVNVPADNSITNAPGLSVAGTVNMAATVMIRLNEGQWMNAGVNGTFTIPLSLAVGLNHIELSIDNGATTIAKRTVTRVSGKPDLALTDPGQDRTSAAFSATITGFTEPTAASVAISLAGEIYPAVAVDPATGSFSQLVNFTTPGMTYPITITADDFGNTSTIIRNIIFTPNTAADLNHDGQSDIIWTDTTTNSSKVWFLSGVTKTGEAPLPPSPGTGWTIVGKGDFNHDGKTDIVWRNQSSGQNLVWYMDGVTKSGEANLPSISSAWLYGGTGDFNADGKADILWRNPATGACNVWYMNGISRMTNGIGPVIASAWTLGGTGDFDGDGIPDIVWRNPATGAVNLWFMNADFTRRANGTGPTIASSWVLSGVVDFDGDGVPDLLWRNPATGANNAWYMNSAFTRRSNGIGTALPGSSWEAVGK